jgi:hypothetical protein
MNADIRRKTIVARLLSFRRGAWEGLATFVIGLGILMLMQPFSMTLYTYSFVTTLAGTALFIIVSKFPD